MSRCLIFDADDTLWENNIYFERAIEEFLELMKPVSAELALIRAKLRQVEKELIPVGGYGSNNFIFALKETFCRIYRGANGGAYLQGIEQIGERLLNHPLELRPGVISTLPPLSREHRLMLFSKGDLKEQSAKLQRSGLRRYFDRIIIVPEKDTLAYHSLLRDHELAPEKTFMIGNSPRSDVVPALAAGLWAVYIPHPVTWDHEDHPIEPHPRLLHAESFELLPTLLTHTPTPR
ncbi:MAG: HAD hydrolase-like protein [Acidobacteria bacterium]|nr:HAD hydrolase-like protein [Acidobacteriota bacterium]